MAKKQSRPRGTFREWLQSLPGRFAAGARSLVRPTPEQKKKRRYDAVMKQQGKIGEAINRKRVGKREIALIEGFDPVSDTYFCRTEKEAPEIDGKLYLVGAPKNAFAPGDMVDVIITDAMDYDLICEIAQIKR